MPGPKLTRDRNEQRGAREWLGELNHRRSSNLSGWWDSRRCILEVQHPSRQVGQRLGAVLVNIDGAAQRVVDSAFRNQQPGVDRHDQRARRHQRGTLERRLKKAQATTTITRIRTGSSQ